MTHDEYIAQTNGKGVDFDNAYGFQCVDLARDYCKKVLRVTLSPPVVGAKDIWNSYNEQAFTRIENTPQAVVQKGDIVVWGEKYGKFGHIAIALSGDKKRMQCLSQNDPVGTKTSIKDYTYKHILGWLRPIGAASKTETGMTDREYRDMYYRALERVFTSISTPLSLPVVDDWAKHPDALEKAVQTLIDRVTTRQIALTEREKELEALKGKNNALEDQVEILQKRISGEVREMESPRFKLNSKDLRSIGRGALIALAGALIVFLTDVVAGLDFGEFTPFVVAGSAVVVNFLRKWVAQNR